MKLTKVGVMTQVKSQFQKHFLVNHVSKEERKNNMKTRNDSITAKEAAELLGLSGSHFRVYCRAGKFETARKVRGTVWYIDRKEVEDIVQGKKLVDFSGAFGELYGE